MPVRMGRLQKAVRRKFARIRWQGSSDRLPGWLYAEQLRFKRSGSAVGVVAAGTSAVVNAHTAAGGNPVLLLIICTS
jgi:hypothetical protein